MAVAAYLTVIGVATSMVVGDAARGGSTPPAVLAALVLLFGASIPIGGRPWSRSPWALRITLVVDLALLAALLYLAPSPWMPAILFFILIPVSSRVAPSLRFAFYAAGPLLTFAAAVIEGRLPGAWSGFASLVPGFVAIIVFAESYRAVRESSQESKRLLDELVSAQAQLRSTAVIEERQRLAQEMHDSVGHRLTAASVHLEAACRIFESDPARAAEHAAISREQVRAGLTELRAAVSSLAAPALEGRSLRRRIAETVSVFRAGGSIAVSTDLDPGADELDGETATVLLRCVQEGLTNVQKHAPGAHARVALAVLPEEGRIELLIEDTGAREGNAAAMAAAPPPNAPVGDTPGGFGLRSLRERAAAVGGWVDFIRRREGARLTVTLPAAGP